MENNLWQFSLELFHMAIWVLILIGIFFFLVRKCSIKLIVITTTLVTLTLISLGAYVRLADAGLGCPDWPGCYGKLTPESAKGDIIAAELNNPNGPVTAKKAWIEMTHRYLASVVGIMIIAIFVKSFSFKNTQKKQGKFSRKLNVPFFLVLAVIFQGLLGKWTVTMLLKPAVVTLHLAGGMLILGLLAYMVGDYRPRLPKISDLGVIQKLVSLAVVAVFLQIILGGWVSTNYAGLACVDFPTCHDVITPDMNFSEGFNIFRELGKNADGGDISHSGLTAIHMVHRLGAFVVSLILVALAYKLIRNPNLLRDGALVVVVLSVQIALGIINVIYLLPFFAAVAHNTVAGVLLSVLVMLKSRLKNSQ